MANILICMGKKKTVQKVVDYMNGLGKKRTVEVLATNVTGKKVMIWNYDELKVLFRSEGKITLQLDRAVVKALDFITIKPAENILLKMQSPKLEDDNLRWNIITRTTAFQLRGGRLDITEEIEERGTRTYRKCFVTLVGPPHSVLSLKDILIKENLCESGSIEYVL